MRRFYEPRGRTQTVITVHALDDGLVIPDTRRSTGGRVRSVGRTAQLLQLFTATESTDERGGFTPALEALTAWVERGVIPTTASVNAVCGNCLTTVSPGPFGTKSPERRQKGAPLRTIVCTGAPGDCPAGATCDVAKRRCK